MGVIIDIDGMEKIEKRVESFRFVAAVPEDSNARTSDLSATVEIKGRIVRDSEGKEPALQLEEWSRVSATGENCYRNMTIIVVSESKAVRQYILPNAFVVDYTEEFDIQEGIGHFTLIARQKKDNLEKIDISGGFGVSE